MPNVTSEYCDALDFTKEDLAFLAEAKSWAANALAPKHFYDKIRTFIVEQYPTGPGKNQDLARESEPSMVEYGGEEREITNDPNHIAYLRDSDELESAYPGCIVAYMDGSRVAVAINVKELLQSIPQEYRSKSLFIKEIPDKIIEFRSPFTILD